MRIVAKPAVVTWLPTRQCTLDCANCRMKNSGVDELMEEDIFKIITVLKKHFADCYIVVSGGDIAAWGKERVKRFIKRMKGLQYTIVTQGLLLDVSFVWDLRLLGMDSVYLTTEPFGCLDRIRKRYNIFELVDRMKEIQIKHRKVVVVGDRDNFRSIPQLVALLSRQGCWSEVHPHITYPSHDYDFGFFDPRLSFRKADYHMVNGVMKELLNMKKSGYKVGSCVRYLQNFADNVCRDGYGYRCYGMTNMVIDTDGSIRPCMYLHGKKTRMFNVLEWAKMNEIPFGNVHVAWKEDFQTQCKGCYWYWQWSTEDIILDNRHLGPLEVLKKVKNRFGGSECVV